MLLEKELNVVEYSYYEATATRAQTYPTLAQDLSADVCVIGGGYAGLASALELAERGYDVVLLEAQRIGWGASGRNGGQVIAGFGLDGESAIAKQFSPEDTRRAWDISLAGMQWLHERIARHRIECEYSAGYLHVAVSKHKAKMLCRWVEHVERNFGYAMQAIESAELRDWIASERYEAAAFDAGSGHLHPLKYCLGLAAAATAAGVRIFENSAVYSLERGPQPLLKTAQGQVACRFAVIAGNVYVPEYSATLMPDVMKRILPIGTYMIATEPMAQARAQTLIRHRAAASDNNFILDYFRVTADNRLLFGGGDSYSGSSPRSVMNKLQRQMLRVFPHLHDLAITHAWGGFVDMTMNRAPNFGRINHNIYYLQGFSGHGVAMTGIAGRLVAEAIAGQAERFDLMARIRHHGFPSANALRVPMLTLGMWYYRLRDLL